MNPRVRDTLVPVISWMYTDAVCSPLPYHGPGEIVSVAGCCTGPYYFTIWLDGLGKGRGRGQVSQDGTSRTQECVYAVTPQTKIADHSVIQGMFLLSHLWARVLFDFGTSHSLLAASCVKELGFKVETLEELLHVSSHLGTGVRIDQIYRDFELEISGILLTMDLRVMDMSEFDVILGMD